MSNASNPSASHRIRDLTRSRLRLGGGVRNRRGRGRTGAEHDLAADDVQIVRRQRLPDQPVRAVGEPRVPLR